MTALQLGYTNPLTDAFGAHPTLGGPLDLNDGQTYTLVMPDGLELPPPPRTLVPAGNLRSQGERIVRSAFRRNREAVARLVLGPMASTSALTAAIRTLVAWLDAPPQQPVTLKWQPFGASVPVYLDVVGAAHDLPEDEGQWLRRQFEPIELVFLCRPGMRGDRVTLSNLAWNPGFEAPSGPGVTVFSDSFATLNAYAVKVGGALAQDLAQYADQVRALAPTHYYRLDETSGATAFDSSGGGSAANGTYTNTGALSLGQGSGVHDTGDLSLGFTAGGNGYVSLPTTGLPSGTNLWSVSVWVNMGATPGTNSTAVMFGNGAAQYAIISWTSAGNLVGGINGATNGATNGTVSVAAPTVNAWHHVALTFDGTTIRLYVDGTSAGFNTPSSPNLGTGTAAIGAFNNGGTIGNTWGVSKSGFLDEVSIHTGTALSSGQISALYTAGHNALSSASNTTQLASGNRVAFGSPAWGPLQGWQARFRFYAGATATFYLHLADASDYLACQVTQTAITLVQTVGGVGHQVATQALAQLTNGVEYWLQLVQFPVPADASNGADPAYVQATLSDDNGLGAVGTQITQIAGPTFDSVTALAGQPQIGTSGGPLGLGGAFATVHTVALFGPGGWGFAGTNGSATGPSSGAWDGTRAELGQSGTATAGTQTFPNGPVTSFGSARVDLAPAGTVDCSWDLYAGGTPAGTGAMPVKTAGDTLGLSAWVKSSGLGNAATIKLEVFEYSGVGGFLRSGVVATLTGNQAGWTQLAGTYATGASCLYADVRVHVADTNAGASANGTVWADDVQVWDQTSTGQAAMPYCELRFPQSPAQLVVSGVLGDLPAPAWAGIGAYLSSWPPGSQLLYALGRKGQAQVNAGLVAPCLGSYGPTFTPTGTPVLDATSYGGLYVKATVGTGGWNPRALSPRVADAQGVYHVLTRFRTQDAGPTGMLTRAKAEHLLDPWFVDVNTAKSLGTFYGPFSSPLVATNVWTLVDAGQVAVPSFPSGALNDPAQLYTVPRAEWAAPQGDPGAEGDAGWLCLLPVDGSLVMGTINNPSNSQVTVTTEYLWTYLDGLLVQRGAIGDGPAWTYSLEAGPMPAPAHGGGGPGTQTSGPINVNAGADPYLVLDPTIAAGSAAAQQGVNQLVGYATDGTGQPLALLGELAYSPLYLYPR